MEAVLLIIALSLFSLPAQSVELHPFLADNLVLARAPLSPRLWGWGTPGEDIVVALDGQAVGDPTQVDSDGEWVLDLPPRDASIGPHTLTLTGSESGSVTLQNVAFGDVFLCSGQSNMQMGVNAAFNASDELADSANYPHLRLATVALVAADTPQSRAASAANYVWAVSGPNAFAPVADKCKRVCTCGPDDTSSAFSWFSATCYFFGRDLYKSLGQKVPIGLVASSWGGQTVETFSSPDAIGDETCGGTKLEEEIAKPGSSSTAMLRRLPSNSQLWNGMIYPLIKMRFAGAIWCAFLVCKCFLTYEPLITKSLQLFDLCFASCLYKSRPRGIKCRRPLELCVPLSSYDFRLAQEDGPESPILLCSTRRL
jgi:sialate O-acetylesterase